MNPYLLQSQQEQEEEEDWLPFLLLVVVGVPLPIWRAAKAAAIFHPSGPIPRGTKMVATIVPVWAVFMEEPRSEGERRSEKGRKEMSRVRRQWMAMYALDVWVGSMGIPTYLPTYLPT